jgi:hypothetical protein
MKVSATISHAKKWPTKVLILSMVSSNFFIRLPRSNGRPPGGEPGGLG